MVKIPKTKLVLVILEDLVKISFTKMYSIARVKIWIKTVLFAINSIIGEIELEGLIWIQIQIWSY